MRIVVRIVRHGIREDAEDSTWKTRATIPTDPPLSRRGFKQAREVGQSLRSKGVDMIFASPYLRTLQTASSISKSLSQPVPIRMEPGLREWVHRPNFPSCLHLSKEQALESFSLIDSNYQPTFHCPVTTENEEKLQVRCNAFVRHFTEEVRVLATQLQHTKDTLSIVLVTHAASAICLIRAFSSQYSSPVRVATCSLTTVVYDTRNESPAWSLITQSGVDHLSEGSQCAWGFEDMPKKTATTPSKTATAVAHIINTKLSAFRTSSSIQV